MNIPPLDPKATFPNWLPPVPAALYAWHLHTWLAGIAVYIALLAAFILLGRFASGWSWSASRMSIARWTLFFVGLLVTAMSGIEACDATASNCHRVFF